MITNVKLIVFQHTKTQQFVFNHGLLPFKILQLRRLVPYGTSDVCFHLPKTTSSAPNKHIITCEICGSTAVVLKNQVSWDVMKCCWAAVPGVSKNHIAFNFRVMQPTK
jgi:hypothetical protein